MSALHYATGNQSKFDNAKQFLSNFDIEIKQSILSLDEIQSDSGKEIVERKVRGAFDSIGEAVFINDATWSIPALNGFPGPYMKYISKWLSNHDLLNLMEGKSDQTIKLIDFIAYKDSEKEKVFTLETEGFILETPEGDSPGPEIRKIISLSEDRKSLASSKSTGFSERESESWKTFAQWLKAQQPKP